MAYFGPPRELSPAAGAPETHEAQNLPQYFYLFEGDPSMEPTTLTTRAETAFSDYIERSGSMRSGWFYNQLQQNGQFDVMLRAKNLSLNDPKLITDQSTLYSVVVERVASIDDWNRYAVVQPGLDGDEKTGTILTPPFQEVLKIEQNRLTVRTHEGIRMLVAGDADFSQNFHVYARGAAPSEQSVETFDCFDGQYAAGFPTDYSGRTIHVYGDEARPGREVSSETPRAMPHFLTWSGKGAGDFGTVLRTRGTPAYEAYIDYPHPMRAGWYYNQLQERDASDASPVSWLATPEHAVVVTDGTSNLSILVSQANDSSLDQYVVIQPGHEDDPHSGMILTPPFQKILKIEDHRLTVMTSDGVRMLIDGNGKFAESRDARGPAWYGYRSDLKSFDIGNQYQLGFPSNCTGKFIAVFGADPGSGLEVAPQPPALAGQAAPKEPEIDLFAPGPDEVEKEQDPALVNLALGNQVFTAAMARLAQLAKKDAELRAALASEDAIVHRLPFVLGPDGNYRQLTLAFTGSNNTHIAMDAMNPEGKFLPGRGFSLVRNSLGSSVLWAANPDFNKAGIGDIAMKYQLNGANRLLTEYLDSVGLGIYSGVSYNMSLPEFSAYLRSQKKEQWRAKLLRLTDKLLTWAGSPKYPANEDGP